MLCGLRAQTNQEASRSLGIFGNPLDPNIVQNRGVEPFFTTFVGWRRTGALLS
jgi:hypothetical protein